MILKNRSSAISITDEDIRELTDRFEVVYAVADDPDAIPPPLDAAAESGLPASTDLGRRLR
jgi:hypothetical protein